MAGVVRPRRLLVPEVVQTSAMDCGPAALKCLLEGFGIPVSYGRLREACQTDVDGTSIDTLEDVARQLRLDAVQVMLPVDHLLLPEAEALPALVVVTLPSGFTHFIVLWRRHGPWVQVMDPGSGRRWLSGAQLLRDLYVHKLRVPSADWYAWATSNAFLAPLARRLADLGLRLEGKRWITEAAGASGWRALAALDAGTRLVGSLVRAEAIRPGREAHPVLQRMLERAANTPLTETGLIPERYWSVRPALPAPGEAGRLCHRRADPPGRRPPRGARSLGGGRTCHLANGRSGNRGPRLGGTPSAGTTTQPGARGRACRAA